MSCSRVGASGRSSTARSSLQRHHRHNERHYRCQRGPCSRAGAAPLPGKVTTPLARWWSQFGEECRERSPRGCARAAGARCSRGATVRCSATRRGGSRCIGELPRQQAWRHRAQTDEMRLISHLERRAALPRAARLVAASRFTTSIEAAIWRLKAAAGQRPDRYLGQEAAVAELSGHLLRAWAR